MARIVYVGPDEQVETEPTGLVVKGDVVEVTDDQAGGLVGYGDGLWQYAPEGGKKAAPVDPAPVDPAPADPIDPAAPAA
jgi:hypothetical protein